MNRLLAIFASCALLIGVVTAAQAAGFNPINGTARGETLTGTRGPDKIQGGGGKDLIIGGLGADFLSGGDGDDIIDANALPVPNPRRIRDNDLVYCGPGKRDVVYYNAGDRINGDCEFKFLRKRPVRR